jgi:hypothetical protein
MATLMQLRRMVRNRLGVPSSDSFFRDDVLDDAINSAIATFEAERNWPWQLRSDTVVAQPDGTVALPSDWRSTRAVYLGRDELGLIAPYDLFGHGDEPGTPSVFSHIGNVIEVRARPSEPTELRLMYYRNAALLANDIDEPDMPANAYPAIVAKAAQLSATREDDRPSATTHLIEYEQWLQRLLNTSESSKRPVGRRIRPGNWT